jgi:hypothetical protein
MFAIYAGSNRVEINYLADPWTSGLLSVSCIVHVLRWRELFRSPDGRTFASATGLAVAMRSVGEEAYKRVPYLPGLLPSDTIIDEQARAAVQATGTIHVSDSSELFLILFRSRRLVLGHAGIAVLCVAFLCIAGFPSFGRGWAAIPYSLPILASIGAGIGIYAVATLIFLALSLTADRGER